METNSRDRGPASTQSLSALAAAYQNANPSETETEDAPVSLWKQAVNGLEAYDFTPDSITPESVNKLSEENIRKWKQANPSNPSSQGE